MLEILEFGNKFAVGIFDIYIIVRLLNAIFKGKLYDKRFLYFVILLQFIPSIFVQYFHEAKRKRPLDELQRSSSLMSHRSRIYLYNIPEFPRV